MDNKCLDELYDLFEEKHIYDIRLNNLKKNEVINLIECLKNNSAIPLNDKIILWKMKYHKKYDKQILFKMMLKNTCPCSMLVFSSLCSKDDKDVYRNEYFSIPSVKNNTNVLNYFRTKMIVTDELNKKIKSKEQFLSALNYVKNINDDFLKIIPYFKYLSFYFTSNYDKALYYLIIFLSNIKYYNPDCIDIFYDKLNIIKFYNEINKLPNKDIFVSLIQKISNDKTIKYINSKLSKNKNTNKCINCKSNNQIIDFYNCNHFYCLECITEKKCPFCKNKFII